MVMVEYNVRLTWESA